MKQVEQTPDVDAISLNNIDVLSKWRVEIELPLMEEAPAWLEEQQRQQEQEEKQLEDFMRANVPTSAPPSTPVDVSFTEGLSKKKIESFK